MQANCSASSIKGSICVTLAFKGLVNGRNQKFVTHFHIKKLEDITGFQRHSVESELVLHLFKVCNPINSFTIFSFL